MFRPYISLQIKSEKQRSTKIENAAVLQTGTLNEARPSTKMLVMYHDATPFVFAIVAYAVSNS